MKHLRIILTIVCMFFCVPFFSIVHGQEEGRRVVILEDEVVEGDVINAGETVQISGAVTGDVIVGGGQVFVDGVVDGDLLIGGGMITMSGEVGQDMRIGGGQVTISGVVSRNVTIAGGNIEFTPDSRIAGNLTVAGGNVMLEGPIDGNIKAGVGNLVLGSSVGGNVEAGVGTLQVLESASVAGDLTYFSDEETDIAPGVVSGSVVHRQLPMDSSAWRGLSADGEKAKEQALAFMSKFRFSFLVWKFLAMVSIGLLLLKLAPNFMKQTAEEIGKNPWKALGLGFLIFIMTPFAAIVLLFTVIGVPLGFFAFIAYGLLLYIGKFFVAYWAGLYALKQMNITNRRGWAFVLGAILYLLIINIRYIGGVVSFGSTLIGVGAYAMVKKRLYDALLKKHMV